MRALLGKGLSSARDPTATSRLSARLSLLGPLAGNLAAPLAGSLASSLLLFSYQRLRFSRFEQRLGEKKAVVIMLRRLGRRSQGQEGGVQQPLVVEAGPADMLQSMEDGHSSAVEDEDVPEDGA